MTFEVIKITPQNVFLTALTAEEFKKIHYLKHSYAKNKPTGNEFMDALAEMVSKYLMLDSTFYAQQMGLSSRFLAKLVRLYTGITFVQWRNTYAVLAAYELLRDTDCSLKEIALRMGFSGATPFGRWFAKETNETPARWRNRVKNKKKRQEKEQMQELKALVHSGQLYKENGVWRIKESPTE